MKRFWAHLSLIVFPTSWALHVLGQCFCRSRAQCPQGKHWHSDRRDLRSGDYWT